MVCVDQVSLKRKDADVAKLHGTIDSLKQAQHAADSTRRSLEHRCAELSNVVDDLSSDRTRLQSQLQREQDEV